MEDAQPALERGLLKPSWAGHSTAGADGDEILVTVGTCPDLPGTPVVLVELDGTWG